MDVKLKLNIFFTLVVKQNISDSNTEHCCRECSSETN